VFDHIGEQLFEFFFAEFFIFTGHAGCFTEGIAQGFIAAAYRVHVTQLFLRDIFGNLLSRQCGCQLIGGAPGIEDCFNKRRWITFFGRRHDVDACLDGLLQIEGDQGGCTQVADISGGVFLRQFLHGFHALGTTNGNQRVDGCGSQFFIGSGRERQLLQFVCCTGDFPQTGQLNRDLIDGWFGIDQFADISQVTGWFDFSILKCFFQREQRFLFDVFLELIVDDLFPDKAEFFRIPLAADQFNNRALPRSRDAATFQKLHHG